MKNTNRSSVGVLVDGPKLNVEKLTKWLTEFKETHYKNRFLTDHFWSICHISNKLKVDVRSILGEEIWKELRKDRPRPFNIEFNETFERSVKCEILKPNKFYTIDFHL